jgi:hypothetical protein
VRLTREVLLHPELAEAMASTNYELAQRYYSYAVAPRRLQTLIRDLTSEDVDGAGQAPA